MCSPCAHLPSPLRSVCAHHSQSVHHSFSLEIPKFFCYFFVITDEIQFKENSQSTPNKSFIFCLKSVHISFTMPSPFTLRSVCALHFLIVHCSLAFIKFYSACAHGLLRVHSPYAQNALTVQVEK